MAGDDFSPPSPLGDSLLDNPLCGDLMDDLREISQSLGDGSLGFDFPEYQSCAEPEGSSLGEDCRAPLWFFRAMSTGLVTCPVPALQTL